MGIAHRIRDIAVKRAHQAKDLVVRELKANTSPAKASFSLSLGVFVGFSPLYGLQTLLLLALAFILRLNRPLALLGGSTTPLPLVPFWVAAGIFTGKLVVPIATVRNLLASGRDIFPFSALENVAHAIYTAFMHRFPAQALAKFGQQSGHDLLAGVVQWAVGSTVFAFVTAVATMAVTYPLFKKLRAARMERAGSLAESNRENP